MSDLKSEFSEESQGKLRDQLVSSVGIRDNAFCELVSSKDVGKEDSEVLTMPYIKELPPMNELKKFLSINNYGNGFNYIDWYTCFLDGAGKTQADTEEWVESANSEELDHFVFCVYRGERFGGGGLASLIESGVMLKVFDRIVELGKNSGPELKKEFI